MTTQTEITNRTYLSKRDAILDIFTIENSNDFNVVINNIMHSNKNTIDIDTKVELFKTLVKYADDLNIKI